MKKDKHSKKKHDQKKHDTDAQNKTSRKKHKKDKAKNEHTPSHKKDSKHGANKGKKQAVCPCCGKHCPLTKPKCSKGKRLAARLSGSE